MNSDYHATGRAGALALLLVVVLMSSACSSTAQEPSAEPTTASDAQVNDARFRCLQDRGFAVTRDTQGGVSFEDPEGTLMPSYDAALISCDAELVDAGLLKGTTDDDLRTEYAALTALHECLVDAGLPLVNWPSEDVYVEERGAFNLLESTAPVTTEEAQSACPDQFERVDAL